MSRRLVVACLGLALASQGCAPTMSMINGFKASNDTCLSNPAAAVVDLLIAGASATGIAASDASPGYYVIPGVFGLSGLIGLATAARCRGDFREVARTPRATNTAPTFGEAPVDPEVPDATPEDRGVPVEQALPAVVTLPPKLTPPPPPPPAEPPPRVEPAPTCTLEPRVNCPDGSYCMLVSENVGECRKIH